MPARTVAADPIDIAVVCPVTVLGSINLNSLFEFYELLVCLSFPFP